VRAGAPGGGRVIAVDVADMDPLPGAVHLRLDAREEGAERRLKEALGGPADLVLSDMAAPACGIARVDTLRVAALCEAALALAEAILAPGGAFVAKVLQGGGEAALVARLKRAFRIVKHVKPPASRADSAELYLVAVGFRRLPGSDG
jgi:23S rRNA (uridine2552-2'-O)-methyltransferase